MQLLVVDDEESVVEVVGIGDGKPLPPKNIVF